MKILYKILDSLNNFAKATKNKVIKRSVAIIVEAEKSGGNIQDVMEGVTLSVVQIKKIKDERRSSAFSQIIQGYIVFFIFIAVMIVLQLFLLPQLSEATYDVFQGMTFDFTAGATGEIGDQREIAIDFDNLFMILILIQGFFTGLMIGKFSEGSIKHGIRHSFILMLVGYLLFTISLSIF